MELDNFLDTPKPNNDGYYTSTYDEDDKRPIEWMTAAMNSIDKMTHIRHIIIADEHHPYRIVTVLKLATSTFIGMLASISLIMHLNISQLYSSGAAVRERGGTLSFAIRRQYCDLYSHYDLGIALD
jgi:hypothetical protein